MSKFRAFILLIGLLGAWVWIQRDQFIDPVSGGPLFTTQGEKSGAESRANPTREIAASALSASSSKLRAEGESRLNQLKQELQTWTECYQNGSCPESGSIATATGAQALNNSIEEPLDETLNIQERLIDSLNQLASQLENSGETAALEQVVRQYLSFPNDYVREAALSWHDRLPLSSENLSALIEGVGSSSSQPLQESALIRLRKYFEAGYQRPVTDHLIHQMARGGHFVSEYLARQSQEFIVDANVHQFENLLNTLQPGSRVHTLLDSQIREFRRAQAATPSDSL